MRTLGNILWFLLVGLESGLAYLLAGVLLCITIIGIPLGLQCFKMAKLTVWPFGRDAHTNFGAHPIANVIWLLLSGLWMGLAYLLVGVVFCITVIGIPFGLQCFKLAKLACTPFGAMVI